MPTGIYVRSPEIRQGIREGALKRCREDPEWRKRFSHSFLGKHPSIEARNKMAQGHRAHWAVPEWKQAVSQKISLGKRGKPHSQQHRQNISKALQGHYVSPETRQRLRVARLLYHLPVKMTSIERILHDAFTEYGLKFEMHKTMFGRFQPDFVFEQGRLIVEADGDYWHNRPDHVRRDEVFNRLAHNDGWVVWRLSEKLIHTCAPELVNTIVAFLESSAKR